jgi:hypothetical protein
MCTFKFLMPATLLTLGLSAPAFAAGASPRPPEHRTQPLRKGQGQPRGSAAAEARTAPAGTATAPGRVRPYQVPKPGEGAPKS